MALENTILAFVDYGITIVVIMLIWEVIRLFRVGPKAGGGSPAGAVGGFMRKQGWLPGTQERKDKLEKDTAEKQVEEQKVKAKKKKSAKKAFQTEMAELAGEQEELEIMKRVEGEVKDITAKKSHLEEAARQTEDLDDVTGKFHSFSRELHSTTEDLEKEVRQWGNVQRQTFRHQQSANKFIEELKKDENVSPKEIQELIILEKSILAKHRETGNGIKVLMELLNRLGDAASRAEQTEQAANKTKLDVSAAQKLLAAIDFSKALNMARALVRLQGDGTKTNPGVIKLLEDITTRIDRYK